MALSSEEDRILDSIVVASENDPERPEFPPDNPRFPATPTYKIRVPSFSNVWLKDESVNPTGTHKDRMAWEIVVTYRDFLLAKKSGEFKGDLPQMSLISSGSAAIAIQSMLKKYKLPDLKVLIDARVKPRILRTLETLGCGVYETDLSKRALVTDDILKMTDNEDGFDITSSEELGPTTRFYDWMSYEIINSSPDYCFIPFGTGNLYENILNINRREVSAKRHDPRFDGDVKKLKRCNFIGATTNNPKSKADKLYSQHLPFAHFNEPWIRLYKRANFCGPDSNVYLVKEEYIDQALDVAKNNNITCEASGIAGLGIMFQMRESLPKGKKMLIVNTGKTKLM
jgi:hypothetical protein